MGKKRESFLNSSTMADAKKLMDRFRKATDELDKKLDEIQQKTGLSEEKVKAYLDNPSNFSPKQWEALQEEKAKFMESFAKLEEGLSPRAKKKLKEIQDKQPVKKSRSSKTRGLRQKWIPM